MVKGKIEEAKQVFRRIAKVNKRTIPDEDLKLPDEDQRLGGRARSICYTHDGEKVTLILVLLVSMQTVTLLFYILDQPMGHWI